MRMIVIALGANLPSAAGVPRETLEAALRALSQRAITIKERSGFYKSTAWPNASDPGFVNAVARIETDLDPAALLLALHEVERMFGRERSVANAPRTLDLDLVDYDDRVQEGPPELPHPRMSGRLFVLLPLAEIAPDWRHPVSGKSVSELIAAAPSLEIARL
jgi:2-amino-4-hydroxy-6-hydroxymethyldihydropteridine diphosphokinase